MINRLPITAKLLPTSKDNLLYLAQSAALTRLAVGVARVWENKPEKNLQPHVSEAEKKKAFWERVFVELFGTSSYILVLHLAQDIAAKALEASKFLKIPEFKRFGNLTDAELAKVNRAFAQVFGSHSNPGDNTHLMSRIIYGEPYTKLGKTISRKSDLAALKKKLGAALYEKATQPGSPLLATVRRFKWAGSGTILAGALTSALFGGPVIQWMNDRVFSPLLNRFIGESKAPQPRQPLQQLANRAPALNTAMQAAQQRPAQAVMPLTTMAPSQPLYSALPAPMPLARHPWPTQQPPGRPAAR